MPVVGIELTTYRLQGGCSTTELNRRTNYISTTGGNDWIRTNVSFRMKKVQGLFATLPFRIILNTFTGAGTLAFRPLPGGPNVTR